MPTSHHNTAAATELMAHIAKILDDPLYTVDPLLPELKSLYQLHGELEKKLEAGRKERQQLQAQLADMNKSLDLATRIDPMTGRSALHTGLALSAKYSCPT